MGRRKTGRKHAHSYFQLLLLHQKCWGGGKCSCGHLLCWARKMRRGDPEMPGPSAAVAVSKQQLVTFTATSRCRASFDVLHEPPVISFANMPDGCQYSHPGRP